MDRFGARGDSNSAQGPDDGGETGHSSGFTASNEHGTQAAGDTAAEAEPLLGPEPDLSQTSPPDTAGIDVTAGVHFDGTSVPSSGFGGVESEPDVVPSHAPDAAASEVHSAQQPEPDAQRLDASPTPTSAPWASAAIKVGSVSGGKVIGMMLVNNGVVPLDQVPLSQAHLSRALDTHASPKEFDSLVDMVRHQTRIVVLDIEENAGRTAHAEALAARLAGLRATRDRLTAALPYGAQSTKSFDTTAIDSDAAGQGSTGWPQPQTVASMDLPASYSATPLAGGQHAAAPDAFEGRLVGAQETVFDVARLLFGGSPYFVADRLPMVRDRVWLLEIPADEDGFQVDKTFGDCLSTLDRLLAERQGRLIILTRPDHWRRIGGSASAHWRSARELLAGVGPAAVARAQLTGRMPGIDVNGWLQDRDIERMVEQSNTVGVVELTEKILAAEQTPPHLLPSDSTSPDTAKVPLDAQTLLTRRIAMVVNSRGLWRRQLLDWHRDPSRTAFERDFQLAAAALTGLSVTHVYHGATLLNGAFGGRGVVDPKGQDAPGVIAMLDAVSGELVADDRIRFPRPGWAESILEYFWVDRPLARGKFLDWLAKAPASQAGDPLETVSDEQRRAAARRITRFALGWAARHQRETPLAKLASAWSQSSRPMWQELVEVLSTVACADGADPAEVGRDDGPLVVHQRYVHQLLLDWAKKPHLAPVVLQICAGPFAKLHTSKALVRLKHAGGHNDAEVLPLLEQVIVRLWQESSARTSLVNEIAGWCDTAKHSISGSGAFACLAAITDTAQSPVARPADADDDGATPDDVGDSARGRGVALLRQTGDYTPDRAVLARCWSVHLDVAREASSALVALWLDAAISDPTQRQDVLDVLRLAVRGNTAENRETRDVVRGVTRKWSTGVPQRNALYQDLSAALDTDIQQNAQSRRYDGGGS
ncbi:hypothetical protein [Kutzneria sp. NPDC051319]|uniref:hypothetical protein n=1 Tax=Kutzneria sp. NPDC051319 TaxID=3155047 RepID=UPI003431D9F2